MGAAPRKRLSGLVLALSAISISYATAQEIPPMQSAWSSWGVLPFSAVDIAVVKTGDTYVMYYTTRPIRRESDPDQSAAPVPARAFSRDLKNWDVDPDVCRTSGELCSPGDPFGALGHRPIVQLRDGRYRMFRKNGDSIVSLISADALTWTREAGARFTRDTSSVWERGARTLVGLAFVRLPDGTLRMYYAGAVAPGSEGTNPDYRDCGGCMGILSAVSTDDGLTWVREAGVRIDPKVLGPLTSMGAFHVIGHSVVAVETGYRIYTTSYIDGAVTYFSSDGLNFELENRIPAIGTDIATVVLPDDRLWLVSSAPGTARHAEGCPSGCDADPDEAAYEVSHMMVHGPQPFKVDSVQWDKNRQSAVFNVAGTFTEPVTLKPILAKSVCSGVATPDRPWCPWHPEYYAVTPATPDNPMVTLTYTGPRDRPDRTRDLHMYFEAVSGEQRMTTAVYCMAVLGLGATTYCP